MHLVTLIHSIVLRIVLICDFNEPAEDPRLRSLLGCHCWTISVSPNSEQVCPCSERASHFQST